MDYCINIYKSNIDLTKYVNIGKSVTLESGLLIVENQLEVDVITIFGKQTLVEKFCRDNQIGYMFDDAILCGVGANDISDNVKYYSYDCSLTEVEMS